MTRNPDPFARELRRATLTLYVLGIMLGALVGALVGLELEAIL